MCRRCTNNAKASANAVALKVRTLEQRLTAAQTNSSSQKKNIRVIASSKKR